MLRSFKARRSSARAAFRYPQLPSFSANNARRLLRCIAALALTAGALPTNAAIPAQERAVLDAFYTQTNGASWTRNTGWAGAAGTECDWYGIVCDATGGHVTEINLTSNNLSGNVPDLTPLNQLRTFVANSNRLSGSLPKISGLTSLSTFYVLDNNFNGTIPPLTGLPSLETFDVGINRLTGTVPSLSGLTNLRDLDLYANAFSGPLPDLAGLARLRSVNFNSNQFTGPIPQLSGLPNLATFVAQNNALTGSIPALSGLTNLQIFNVASNQISGAIPSLDRLPALWLFYVSRNHLTGSVPSLDGLTSLKQFNIEGNELSGSLPQPPSSAPLGSNQSSLCPNKFLHSPSAAWDRATGKSPWYDTCVQPTTTTITSSSPTTVFGQSVTFLATVTSDLSSEVSFYDGQVLLCRSSLSGSPPLTASCDVANLKVGTHSISASFGGNIGNAASASSPLAQIVDKAATSLALQPISGSSQVGSPISVAFTIGVITPGAGTPTGSVQVSIGNSSCIAKLPATSCALSPSDVGSQPILLSYSGDENFSASSASGQITVSLGSSSTSMSAQPNPAFLGETVDLVAQVDGSVVSGTVSFVANGGNTICSATLVQHTSSTSTATCQAAGLALGTRRIVANYSGDPRNMPSVSLPVDLSITKIATTTKINLSPNPGRPGASITASVKISPIRSFSPGPIGTITVGTNALGCTITLPANSCSFTPTSSGKLSVRAAYSGDENYASSNDTASVVITANPTTTTLTSSDNPLISGSNLVLTAEVHGTDPTGNITFLSEDSTTPLCETPLSGSGSTRTATCTLASPGIGVRRIHAVYSGDGQNGYSESSTLKELVITSTPVGLNQFGLTGTWYNPATSGQGLLFQAIPDHSAGTGILFGGWFTYDANALGSQRWYTMQGDAPSDSAYSRLQIYAGTGGKFNSPPKIPAVPVGEAVIQFMDCSHGMLSYDFSDDAGPKGDIPLTRLDANIACTSAGNDNPTASSYLLSGAWYNPDTSGQGLIFDVNPVQNLFFATWYTYSKTGSSRMRSGNVGIRSSSMDSRLRPHR